MYINKSNALFLIYTFILNTGRYDPKDKVNWIAGMRTLGVTFYHNPFMEVWVKEHDFDKRWWEKLVKAVNKEFADRTVFRIVSPTVFKFCREYCLKNNLVWIELCDFTRDFAPIFKELGMTDRMED